MKNTSIASAIAALLMLISFSTQSLASTILSPTAIINNSLGEWSSDLAAQFMIDQSGLSPGFVSGVTDFDSYINSNPTHLVNTFGTLWGSAPNFTAGVVDFDLGSTFSVSRFVMWGDSNAGAPTSGAVKDFNLFASTLPDFSTSTYLGSFTGQSLTGLAIPAQVFSIAPTDARYVRLEIINNYGDQNINLGEVAFAVTPVPLPPAFMLFGSALIGLIAATRRKVKGLGDN